MVLQDAWLFKGTIRENIVYGADGAVSEAAFREATEAAHVDHFVRTLPDGYDTVLDDDATNVSAGEKQLLTIARAFLADPPILILDEATSSVDTRTEVLIQRAMKPLMEGRTSFVIAHRLSTIRDADVILVMRDGRIVEQGIARGAARAPAASTTSSTRASSRRPSSRSRSAGAGPRIAGTRAEGPAAPGPRTAPHRTAGHRVRRFVAGWTARAGPSSRTGTPVTLTHRSDDRSGGPGGRAAPHSSTRGPARAQSSSPVGPAAGGRVRPSQRSSLAGILLPGAALAAGGPGTPPDPQPDLIDDARGRPGVGQRPRQRPQPRRGHPLRSSGFVDVAPADRHPGRSRRTATTRSPPPRAGSARRRPPTPPPTTSTIAPRRSRSGSTELDEPPVADDDTVAVSEERPPRTSPTTCSPTTPTPTATPSRSPSVANVSGGQADLTGGVLTFTPDADACGDGYGSFDYTVTRRRAHRLGQRHRRRVLRERRPDAPRTTRSRAPRTGRRHRRRRPPRQRRRRRRRHASP